MLSAIFSQSMSWDFQDLFVMFVLSIVLQQMHISDIIKDFIKKEWNKNSTSGQAVLMFFNFSNFNNN